jgi:biopolymer transport protein ExbB/TolQ
MSWMIIVNILAKVILLILVVMSIYTMAIILERKRFFKEFGLINSKEDLLSNLKDGDLKAIKDFLTPISHNPFAVQMLSILNSKNNYESIKLIEYSRVKALVEGKIKVLATFGSTAPFIGLLGTVFGIIVAFGELSLGKADSSTIMYALAEALILTAVGLLVAIPSVISFNHFNQKLKNEREQVEVVQRVINSIQGS